MIVRPHLTCGLLFLCSDESSERDKSSDGDDDESDGDDDDQDDVKGDDDVDDNDDDGNGVCDNDNDDSCGDMNDDDKELQEAEHRNSIQNEKWGTSAKGKDHFIFPKRRTQHTSVCKFISSQRLEWNEKNLYLVAREKSLQVIRFN